MTATGRMTTAMVTVVTMRTMSTYWQQWPASKANSDTDGMDEDAEGPKVK